MAKIGYLLEQDIVDILDDQTLNELTGGRKAIGDNPAVEGDDDAWRAYESTAIEKVKAYSRHWYDMDTEMRPYYEYDIAEAFTAGQRVASAIVNNFRTLYVCIQDAPAGTLLTEILFFEPKDDRNPVVLEVTVIFVVYNLSRRKNPRIIPEQRQLDYDNSITTLKDIQTGKIMLEIAERTDVEADDPGQQIAYGDFEGVTKDYY